STSLVLLPLPSFPTRRSSDLTPCNVASPIGRRSSTGIRRRPRGRGESFSPRSPGLANMFCRSIFHIRRRDSSRPTAHGSGTSLCDEQYLLGSLGHMSDRSLVRRVAWFYGVGGMGGAARWDGSPRLSLELQSVLLPVACPPHAGAAARRQAADGARGGRGLRRQRYLRVQGSHINLTTAK